MKNTENQSDVLVYLRRELSKLENECAAKIDNVTLNDKLRASFFTLDQNIYDALVNQAINKLEIPSLTI